MEVLTGKLDTLRTQWWQRLQRGAEEGVRDGAAYYLFFSLDKLDFEIIANIQKSCKRELPYTFYSVSLTLHLAEFTLSFSFNTVTLWAIWMHVPDRLSLSFKYISMYLSWAKAVLFLQSDRPITKIRKLWVSNMRSAISVPLSLAYFI